MKNIVIAFVVIVLLFACEKESSKDENSKLKDKEWFKDLQLPCDEITICSLRIHKGVYENDTIYFVSYSGALCDMYFNTSLVNVDGDTIKNYKGYDGSITIVNEVEFLETIYRCEDD